MELCCYPDKQKHRFYEIEAIQLPIVYNKYGDHDPDGLLYVLKKDAERIREGALRNFSLVPPQPFEEVKPLVIRANVGDVVKEGQVIMVLEAMKMENDIVAPCDGTVTSIVAKAGDSVETNQTLATIG